MVLRNQRKPHAFNELIEDRERKLF